MSVKGIKKLIFIYNADTGFRNLIIDGAHKILSPKTYPCSLCGITYGMFSEKKAWKNFKRNVPLEMEFLYKDEFREKYASKFGYKFTFPIILSSDGSALEVFMAAETLNEIRDATEFIVQLKSRMEL